MASYLSSNGRHEQAVDELRRVIAMQPSFALGRMLLGWSLLRKGDFDDAIAETEMALLLSPGDRFTAVYQHNHGLALLGAHRFSEAFLSSGLPPRRLSSTWASQRADILLWSSRIEGRGSRSHRIP